MSSNQIAGAYSLSYASSSATTAGNFVASNAFTIDSGDQAKLMAIRFYYKAVVNATNVSWTDAAATASFGMAIYDVSNSSWIIPSKPFDLIQSTGTGIATAYFQTSGNGSQYRLVIYNANATAGAATIYLDDLFVGPSDQAGPSKAVTFKAHMVTDVAVAANGIIKYDTEEFDSHNAHNPSTGLFTAPVSGRYYVSAVGDISNAFALYVQVNGVTGPYLAYQAGGLLISGSTSVDVQAGQTIAILSNAAGTVFGGSAPWVNSVSIHLISAANSASDGRVVAGQWYLTSNSASLSGDVVIPSSTAVRDTHGMYNGEYVTAPESGFYQINISVYQTSASGFNTTAYKIGSGGSTVYFGSASDGGRSNGSAIIYLNAGERWYPMHNSQAAGSYQAGIQNTQFSIAKVSGAGTTTPGSYGSDRVERAVITPTSGSSCTVSNEGTDWLGTATPNGIGDCTVNFNSGIFSATPVCVLTSQLSLTTVSLLTSPRIIALSTTGIRIMHNYRDASQGNIAADPVQIICMGTR